MTPCYTAIWSFLGENLISPLIYHTHKKCRISPVNKPNKGIFIYPQKTFYIFEIENLFNYYCWNPKLLNCQGHLTGMKNMNNCTINMKYNKGVTVMKRLIKIMGTQENDSVDMLFTSNDIFELLSQIHELKNCNLEVIPRSDNSVEFIIGETSYQVRN